MRKIRDGTYFSRNCSSTTAEMSRRGFPIPKRIPSYAIEQEDFDSFRGEKKNTTKQTERVRVCLLRKSKSNARWWRLGFVGYL